VVENIEPFAFEADQSFTIQAWFQTSSRENQVIASRPGAYSLGVKAGRLSAWIMQDGGQFVEAAGAANAADGQWHHAAAVYGRQAQTLAVYFDGKPDGEPRSIAAIGRSTSATPLTLGAFGGGFPFDGSLDEISIHRCALTPSQLSFNTDYASVPASTLGAQAGAYTTAPCDWGQPVRITALRTAAILSDGTISARLETSHDEFKTIEATDRLELHSGEQVVTLKQHPATRFARVVFSLATRAGAKTSPVLSAVEFIGEPTRP
jgi:hypothetical protein